MRVESEQLMKPMELVQAVVVPFASAGIGGWLTARFALGRFYREKLWERKTAAYTAIFEALHDIGQWYDAHLTAEMEMQQLPGERSDELSMMRRKAVADLERRIAAESWVLPSECQARLSLMKKELDKDQQTMFEVFDTGAFEVSKATTDLRVIVRNDLGLERPPWYRRIFKAAHL